MLAAELQSRGWTVLDLARQANMPYETVRRAVKGIGSISLQNANKLVVAVGKEVALEEPA